MEARRKGRQLKSDVKLAALRYAESEYWTLCVDNILHRIHDDHHYAPPKVTAISILRLHKGDLLEDRLRTPGHLVIFSSPT
ncbi:hypothetical protein Hypma_013459 [Hypsizygus marmoreus]|uniref:Uncharacterized protein n=1 Tax=Hypsizygus marmoreus TaxID=39966 RepID=A0A369JC77_HYPMA|nr:hypothetical protein Hypma_013459 [Hypsizygus marmoreus]